MLAVARLHPQKGLDVLQEAARSLPEDVVVAVAGEGPQRDSLGPPLRLLGARDDVADLLAAADVVVLPSRWEGSPLAAHEALLAGRPLVTTAAGGIPALVGDADPAPAVLVSAEDPAALATALRRLLDDPAERAALAERARVRAEQWPDAQRTVEDVLAVYLELAGDPVRAGRVMIRRLLAALIVVASLVLAVPPANAVTPVLRPSAEHPVVVVGVDGLTWDQIGPRVPALDDLARTSSTGLLAGRGADETTSTLDAWATLSAGNRARAHDLPDPGPVRSRQGPGGRGRATSDVAGSDGRPRRGAGRRAGAGLRLHQRCAAVRTWLRPRVAARPEPVSAAPWCCSTPGTPLPPTRSCDAGGRGPRC